MDKHYPICPKCKLWDSNHEFRQLGIIPIIVCPAVENGKIYMSDELVITHVFDPWVLSEKAKEKQDDRP